MAAPIATFIQVPSDATNTGKKNRTQSRVVGPDTVHEHFVVATNPRSRMGGHKTSSGVITVPAAVQNGTTTGYAWLYNPIGSTIKMAVKRRTLSLQFTALGVDLLSGELRASLFTFSGAGSGTLVTPGRVKSTDTVAQGQMRLASTGLTVTLGATIQGEQYPTMDLATGGAGHWNPYRYENEPDFYDDEHILLPGEGIVWWHAVAVTAANRRLIINAFHEEFE